MNKSGIKDWPESERPREMLLEKGPAAVSDAGLIAILLRVGRQGEDAVTLARRLLRQFGGLGPLLHASQCKLAGIKGLGSAKIATLLAAQEIAKRKSTEALAGKDAVRCADDVFGHLATSMKGLKKEVFAVLYLDQANRILAAENLFEGTVDQSAIYPREIIKRAFEIGSTGLIFAHNHPSGDLKPSPEDIAITQKLFRACEAVDLRPLDHLIITDGGYTSIKDCTD